MHALKIIGGLLAALVVIFFALPLFVNEGPEPAMQRACEARIRLLSKNPATVQFGTPMMLAMEGDRDQFTWTPSNLQMQNGFGAMLGARAVCVTDRKTLAVIDMTID